MGALPLWLQSVTDLWRQESLPQGEIDLGNGRILGAEDVLEGHYRRLATRRQAEAVAKRNSAKRRQVSVQVGDNLMAAITVWAPDLAPLTAVAEEVSGALPLVEPERQFRENLHEALERTHRQQSAQRILGIREKPAPKPASPFGWWMVAAGVLTAVALVWGWRARLNSAPAT